MTPSFDYFGMGISAERYARARPRIHVTAVDKIRAVTRVTTPFSRALDVGCGTGQSSVALAAVADSIVGVDRSTEMLAHAMSNPKVTYYAAAAENIPFQDRQFDLITAGLAFHWFDAHRFLTESHRLLRRSGWLAIYTSGFTGEMVEEPAFAMWFRDEFLRHYPTPPRNPTVITGALAEAHRFQLMSEDSLLHEIEMSADEFIDYELSTTNVIAMVERGESSFDAAAVWMRRSMSSLFEGRSTGTFEFVGKIWCLQKRAEDIE